MRRGHWDLVLEFVSNGADPNTKLETDGSRLLSVAIREMHLPLIRSLLEHGADVNCLTVRGSLALLLL